MCKNAKQDDKRRLDVNTGRFCAGKQGESKVSKLKREKGRAKEK